MSHVESASSHNPSGERIQPKEQQEWTPGRLSKSIDDNGLTGTADAINAALTAEQKKHEQERLRIWREAPNQADIQEAVIAKLNLVSVDALDAEQEKVKQLQAGRKVDFENYSNYTAENEKLKQQLDAEKEKYKAREIELIEGWSAVERDLHKQLSAEQDKVSYQRRRSEGAIQQLAAEQKKFAHCLSLTKEARDEEREKVKTLSDALELAAMYVHRQHDDPERSVSIYEPHLNQIDSAMAKVKEADNGLGNQG